MLPHTLPGAELVAPPDLTPLAEGLLAAKTDMDDAGLLLPLQAGQLALEVVQPAFQVVYIRLEPPDARVQVQGLKQVLVAIPGGLALAVLKTNEEGQTILGDLRANPAAEGIFEGWDDAAILAGQAAGLEVFLRLQGPGQLVGGILDLALDLSDLLGLGLNIQGKGFFGG